MHRRAHVTDRTRTTLLRLAAGCLVAFTVCPAFAQPAVPPAAIAQFQKVIGDRVELVTILGGDYGAAGGIYSFRGGQVADLAITKLGGGGNIAETRPLGDTGLNWAPMLLGNVGHINAGNTFQSGFLVGNKSEYDVLSVQGGAGARFYFTDHLSLAPGLSGIYGHTENAFHSQNAVGDLVQAAARGTYTDWTIDTWSVVPSVQAQYEWSWGRTELTLGSRYCFFHTESFQSSSPVVSVYGDSQLWENRFDADIPLGLRVFNHELHTGGFFSRTELYGHAATGVDADHFYTLNGRLVFDFLGDIWKLQWIGLGASYFFADHFSGWSAGIDMHFKF